MPICPAAILPGGDAWRKHTPVPVIPQLPRRYLSWLRPLVFAVAALTAVVFMPETWFAAVQPRDSRPLPDLTAELRNELDDLQKTEQLPAEELSELREELERIADTADANAPGATLDAVERIEKQLHTLVDLKTATDKILDSADACPDALAASAETAQSLHQMIEDSGWGTTISGEERMPADGGGGDENNEDGDCEETQIGFGASSRGRADAPMSWTNPSEMNSSKFKDRSAKPHPTAADGIVKTGESLSEKDPASRKVKSRTSPASATLGGSAAGSANLKSVSPRHRATVKRFFEASSEPTK